MKPGTKSTQSTPDYQNPECGLEQRVKDLIGRLTLEEKMRMMASRQPAVARLGIPEFHIGGEAAHGLVAADGHVTVFPQTQGLACTWDDELLTRIGEAVSDEARAYYKKRHGLSGLCLWAPTIDMERDPRWGRTEEAYGEDPVLAGRLAGAYIRGMQGEDPFYLKTVPTPKHFYANNNEEDRNSCSASIGPRLKREYYLASFETAVCERKVHSIMAAYNRINGIPAMLHPDLLEIVKGEWGMDGFIVSDGAGLTQLVDTHKYYSDYATAAAQSLIRGVDNFSDDAQKITPIIREAVERGLIGEDDLDRALANVFRIRFRLGQFDPPELDPYASIDEAVICSPEHLALSREAAQKSIVLLRNAPVDGQPVLPLNEKKITKLAVIGPLAATVYRDWYTGQPHYEVSPLTAFTERLGPKRIAHADGSDVVVLRHAEGEYLGTTGWYDGVLAVNRDPGEVGELFRRTDFGWGNQTLKSFSNGCYLNMEPNGVVSASANQVYAWYVQSRFDIQPAPDGSGASHIYSWDGSPLGLNPQNQLAAVSPGKGDSYAQEIEPIFVDIVKDGIEQAVQAAAQADAAIVLVGNNPVLVAKEEIDRPSIELPPAQRELLRRVAGANPRTVGVMISGYPYALEGLEDEVPALVYMAHGGPEGGRALADVLFGDVSPAGRLPMTWYASSEELPDIKNYDIKTHPRTYQYYPGRPLYPFGFGLSYSQFEYGGLRLNTSQVAAEDLLEARVTVTNRGTARAEEVVQLYAWCRESVFFRPQRQLLGFKRLEIGAGEQREVVFTLPARSFRVWNAAGMSWMIETSEWTIAAGPHSGELPVTADFTLVGETPHPLSRGIVIDTKNYTDSSGIILDEWNGIPCFSAENPGDPGRIFLGEFDFTDGKPTRLIVQTGARSSVAQGSTAAPGAVGTTSARESTAVRGSTAAPGAVGAIRVLRGGLDGEEIGGFVFGSDLSTGLDGGSVEGPYDPGVARKDGVSVREIVLPAVHGVCPISIEFYGDFVIYHVGVENV